MMAEPRTTHNPMPPTETPTSVTETTRLVDNEDVEDPGCCVARICKRTMPCLRRAHDCPTCKEIGYDIKNDPLGVYVASAGSRSARRRSRTSSTGSSCGRSEASADRAQPWYRRNTILDGRQLRKRRAHRDGLARRPRALGPRPRALGPPLRQAELLRFLDVLRLERLRHLEHLVQARALGRAQLGPRRP